MNKFKSLAVATALLTAGAVILPATMSSAATAPEAMSTTAAPATGLTLSDLESELRSLSTMTDDELRTTVQDSVIAHRERIDADAESEFEVAAALPAVPLVVWAVGCGVAGIGSVATGAWKDANSAAWAIAGILVGCIPGVGQAAIVRVIIANKATVANALKAVGLTAPALALSGDS